MEDALNAPAVLPSDEAPGTEAPEAPEQGQEPSGEVPQDRSQLQVDPIAELEKLQLDPKVKEALKGGFLRQSDYTKKTQEIASIRKVAEEYQKVQPLIAQILQDPYVQGRFGGNGQPQKQEVQIPDDPVEYGNWIKQQAISEAEARFEAKMARESDIQQASLVDPRLADNEPFAKTVASMVAADPAVRAGQKSYTQSTREAVAMIDGLLKGSASAAKQDLIDKAKSKRMVTPQGGRDVSTAGQAPKNMREAAKMAEEQLGG